MEDVKDLMTHPEGTLAAVEAELANRDAEIEISAVGRPLVPAYS